MRECEIEALGKAAYATKLRPGGVRELGEHTEVYAVRLYGWHARRSDKFLTLAGVALHNADRALYLSPSDFPVPGKRGLSIPEFARVLWSKLPGLTKKSRVILVAYGTAESYGPLDVHDLDARITYQPAGADAYSLKFHEKNGPNVEFMDAGAFFPDTDLGEIAATFGVEYSIPTPKKPDPADEGTRAYIAQDARATWEVWDALRAQFRREYDLDPTVYGTPASCAARVYVSRYLEDSPGGSVGVRKHTRLQAMRSYWGGRAEAFARGRFRGDLNLYDAVSLYPSAAIALGEMPTANSWFRLTPLNMRTARGGICTVQFEFPADETHPCLPVRANTKTYYPLAGTSHCTVHEVRFAQECGAQITLLSGYGYLRGDDSLARYSRDLLARKQAADVARDRTARTMYKLLLNSLYGKFGQHRVGHSLETLRMVCRAFKFPSLDVLLRIPNWEQMAGDLLNGGEGDPIEPEVMIGGQWCPEWAALVQGYARMIESRAMRQYVALTGTTDSILVNGDAGESFEVEGVTFKRQARGDVAVIVRTRLYVLAQGDDVQHAALHGAPKVAQAPGHVLNWDGSDEITIMADRVTKLRDGLTRTGRVVGHRAKEVSHAVGMAWDGKRSVVGDYSEPFSLIESGD